VRETADTTAPRQGPGDALTDPRAEGLEARVAVVMRDLRSACVALSGGVDSSVVLTLAARVLGADRVTAFTTASATMPAGELAAARELAAGLGVEHVVVETDELDDERFASNPRERCYFCKRHLLDEMEAVARVHGRVSLVDGANVDDLGDERPGLRATAERGVRHPLVEAGLGKPDVRHLARALGLTVWDAPSQACLASRIPYGERVTEEKLGRIGAAEQVLRELGFRQCRVRLHGELARVEVEPDQIGRAAGTARADIARRLRALGFIYVSLDLEGFRSGSMNEAPREANGPALAAPPPPGAADAPRGGAGVVP